MKIFISLIVVMNALIFDLHSQSYTSYFTGNSVDANTNPMGGVCLMGGASENDLAMEWFLNQADGGDILVLRASGSNGYNDYMFSGLNSTVNSVETIVFHNSSAANETYIHDKIKSAEAIWFAGGDQWDYISYWRNSPIDSLINSAIENNDIVIGGTSAGMAILGQFYFSAENGTVTSATALSNPYNSMVTVDSSTFIKSKILENTITDTHYDNPDRKGRHIVFLARILEDYGIPAKGIACEEYTAVCIDKNGIAKVFGEYPNENDVAYFIQTNCELTNIVPENCTDGSSLDWNLNNKALKVYKIYGTSSAMNSFNTNTWESGTGGVWENWYVENGVLKEEDGTSPDCSSVSVSEMKKRVDLSLFPNPTQDKFTIQLNNIHSDEVKIEIIDNSGRLMESQILQTIYNETLSYSFDLSKLAKGFYIVKVNIAGNILLEKIVKD